MTPSASRFLCYGYIHQGYAYSPGSERYPSGFGDVPLTNVHGHMRALRHQVTGKPLEVIKLEELPDPEPGFGEVRVRMTHRPINPSDLHTVLGRYGRETMLPATPGHEGVGVVDAIGDGVSDLSIGDRVVPMGVIGTWQEFVTAPAERCFVVPEDVPNEAAAQLFVNPLTALVLLEELDIAPGDWLVQTAATSQVGLAVIQLARRRGIRTFNLVRRPEAVEELRVVGADEVMVADVEADVRAARVKIRNLTGGDGASGAIDGVSGGGGAVAARCLAPGSTMLVYGGMSGHPLTLDASTYIFRRLTVRGFWRTYWYETNPPEEVIARLGKLARSVVKGYLQLPVEAEYDLSDYRQALEHSRTTGRKGKILLMSV